MLRNLFFLVIEALSIYGFPSDSIDTGFTCAYLESDMEPKGTEIDVSYGQSNIGILVNPYSAPDFGSIPNCQLKSKNFDAYTWVIL